MTGLHETFDCLALAFLDVNNFVGTTIALKAAFDVAIHLLYVHVDVERGLRDRTCSQTRETPCPT